MKKNTPALIPILLCLSASVVFAEKAGAPAPTNNSSTPPAANTLAKLPLEHSFKKETTGENKGLYTLTLKNTSAKALTVTAAIEESVHSHDRPKNRTVGPQAIEPGKTWAVGPLAAMDKVTVSADGFEPLKLTVP